MMLSMDRVLQLLAEGKSLEKIAELGDASVADVVALVENARDILLAHHKVTTRKKVVIKKEAKAVTAESEDRPDSDDVDVAQLFSGAELSAIPFSSTLVMNTDGASSGNPGPAGIGIVIFDRDGRQVGKVSSYIGKRTNNYAEYYALVKALKIAVYFKARELRVRTDSELVVKQIKGEYKVKNDSIRSLYEEAMALKKMVPSFKIEHVMRTFNDKADYLAKKAVEGSGDSDSR